MGKNVLFIEYPKCTTCKKAKKWLDEHGVDYVDRHIVDDNPTTNELRTWIAASGLPLRRFFNTSGMLYREMNVKSLLDAGMFEEDALNLLASSGMLVKRPLVVISNADGGEGDSGEITGVLVGFKEADWENALA